MKALVRPKNGRKVFGVFAGLARTLNWDAGVLRLIFVFLTVFTGFFPCIAAYLLAWLVTDEETDSDRWESTI